jgi:hypothetical protein
MWSSALRCAPGPRPVAPCCVRPTSFVVLPRVAAVRASVIPRNWASLPQVWVGVGAQAFWPRESSSGVGVVVGPCLS